MQSEFKTPNELNNEAMKILYEKLGAINTIRFINQFNSGFGDYTSERENIYKDKSVDELESEIKHLRKEES